MTRISTAELVSTLSRSPEKRKTSEGSGFADRMKEAILDVNHRKKEAGRAMEKVVDGSMGVHEGMMKLHESNVSFKLMNAVRGKVMEAYQEIMRMPV